MAAAIREGGFRDSTVADVVRHARTSRRTFYEHFPSKEACFGALLGAANTEMISRVTAAVDRGAPWVNQVRQAVESWITSTESEPAITLSWIRDLPSLGATGRRLQRDMMEGF